MELWDQISILQGEPFDCGYANKNLLVTRLVV